MRSWNHWNSHVTSCNYVISFLCSNNAHLSIQNRSQPIIHCVFVSFFFLSISPYHSFSFVLRVSFFPLASFGCTPGNKTEFLESATLTEEEFQERPIINWDAILFVSRPTELWAVQLILALISLTEAMLLTYLGYKVSLNRLILPI